MEYADIMPSMLNWGVFLFGLGIALSGVAAMIYVAYRFLALVLSMEVGILKEFQGSQKAVNIALADVPRKESQLKEFIKARMAPTEGDFVGADDETQFLNEQVTHLRNQGLTEDELESFIRQAVNSDIGKPEPPG
jgi:hypothetical protein